MLVPASGNKGVEPNIFISDRGNNTVCGDFGSIVLFDAGDRGDATGESENGGRSTLDALSLMDIFL